MMLFWETLQSNKRFRSFIIDTDRGHDFAILVLFYALEYKTDPAKQGVVRMCVFILQTLSTEPNFGKRLNKKFEGQEFLPASIKLTDFDGTYADFLVIVSSPSLLETFVLNLKTVDTYTHYNKQREIGCYISGTAGGYQQHCPISREYQLSVELQIDPIIHIHFCARLFACKRNELFAPSIPTRIDECHN